MLYPSDLKNTPCTVKRNQKISINMLESWCWCCMYTHMLNLGRLVVDSVKAWCRRLGWNCVHAERPIPGEQLGQNWGSCFPSLNHGMKIAHDPCWTPVVPKWCWVYIIRSLSSLYIIIVLAFFSLRMHHDASTKSIIDIHSGSCFAAPRCPAARLHLRGCHLVTIPVFPLDALDSQMSQDVQSAHSSCPNYSNYCFWEMTCGCVRHFLLHLSWC